MKKSLLTIFVVFIVIMSILFAKFVSVKKQNLETKKFNYGYEFYNKDNLNSLDVITVINKEIDNIEKYNV